MRGGSGGVRFRWLHFMGHGIGSGLDLTGIEWMGYRYTPLVGWQLQSTRFWDIIRISQLLLVFRSLPFILHSYFSSSVFFSLNPEAADCFTKVSPTSGSLLFPSRFAIGFNPALTFHALYKCH